MTFLGRPQVTKAIRLDSTFVVTNARNLQQTAFPVPFLCGDVLKVWPWMTTAWWLPVVGAREGAGYFPWNRVQPQPYPLFDVSCCCLPDRYTNYSLLLLSLYDHSDIHFLDHWQTMMPGHQWSNMLLEARRIASQKDFGGFLVKSNRWRFCPRLLYLCSTEVQGC